MTFDIIKQDNIATMYTSIATLLNNIIPSNKDLKSYVPHFVAGSAFFSVSLYILRKNKKSSKNALSPYGERESSVKNKKSGAFVNADFFKKLQVFFKIAIPGIKSPEFRLLIVFSLFLLARTYLSIKISEINGRVVRSIVSVDKNSFFQSLLNLAAATIPASVVNSMINYFLSKLSFCFRSRLVSYFNELYFQSKVPYKVANIDSRISHPDTIITQTITDWCDELANLYSSLSKPILDIVLFSKKLTELIGIKGPLIAFVFYFFSAVLFRVTAPAFGHLAARAIQLEGDFRKSYLRVINYSEEIAFYKGENIEKSSILKAYQKVKRQESYIYNKDYYTSLLHGFVSKYGSFLTAYVVLGIPVFSSSNRDYLEKTKTDRSVIVGDYIRNSNLYINLSLAIGKIVVSYSNLQKLAGYTMLISEFRDVLLDLKDQKFMRKSRNILMKPVIYRSYSQENFIVNDGESIKFENLSIITPNGEVLARDVNIEIKRNMSVLITGPNGCGKSSLFRIFSGLWPVTIGSVVKPSEANLFYIPQKPYLIKGTLRDQLIYPKTANQVNSLDDSFLLEILTLVDYKQENDYVQERDLNQKKDWAEVLSGGEKQQIALARLIFHKPMFAVLDECTSAISFELEKFIYSHCKKLGITLITVSHRKSLWKYHEFVLTFDGQGGYTFREITENDLKA